MFRRQAIDDDSAAWVSNRFEWLISTLGPRTFFNHTQLRLPTRRHFATPLTGSADSAGRLFDEIRVHMGIQHWPVKLVPRAAFGSRRGVRSDLRKAVAGSFYQPEAGGPAVITYNPRLISKRSAFIGTLAHELAHYVLAPHVDAAPGGEAEHELLTDLAVIYAGFGVIDLQGMRDIGWKGYLSPGSRAFALATFLRLKGIDPAVTEPFLDPVLHRRLLRAVAQRDARADEMRILAALRPR